MARPDAAPSARGCKSIKTGAGYIHKQSILEPGEPQNAMFCGFFYFPCAAHSATPVPCARLGASAAASSRPAFQGRFLTLRHGRIDQWHILKLFNREESYGRNLDIKTSPYRGKLSDRDRSFVKISQWLER
jgi:hypothetical protein